MLLKDLANCVENAKIVCGKQNMQNSENTEIQGLSTHDAFCKDGDLFFCLCGEKTDSHLLAADAIARGAVAVVCERELELPVPQIVVPSSRLAMSLIARAFYGNACDKLKIIGITGTNGKTTTAYMLDSILRRAGKKTGLIGTLGIYYGKKKIAPELTTPDPVFLHSVFADMSACGVEYVVMEVSAHALYYQKTAGITFAACIFTNFSRDHLDFFGSMKDYKETKKKLFLENLQSVAILNGDDPVGREIGKLCAKGKMQTVFYGLETPSESFAIVTAEDLTGCECMLNLSDELCRVSLSLTGKHNVYNALAAATCATALGIQLEAVAGGLRSLSSVNGRLERVASVNGAFVFVDFAHTPDGLEKSLSALKGYTKGKMICVFGCGGNRDRQKRPLMGEIAAKKTDFSILTSDNPRYEDPADIIAEIEKGYRRFSKNYVVIPERKDALSYAIGLLKKGDTLLVAGKGGEDTQEIMGIKYSYNDKTAIKEIVARITPLG